MNMSYLQIAGLQISYGEKVVLHNIDLQVGKGEMIALLGPSGCGKTTLLNALCGFIPVKTGEITVAHRDITHSAPEQRNITMVFQSYALWPHLTVARNIGYGLKLRKWRRDDIDRRVTELLGIVNLTGLADVKVTELSGGQRQRVALARALAIEPDVLVLDEPLSNLDAKVRLNVRHEIKTLQKRLGFTSLIVTHDQQEALVMADRIAVLNNGRIEQTGTPEDIYQRPATPFVADFMGADNKISANQLFAAQDISLCVQGKYSADDFRDRTLYFRSADTALGALTTRMPDEGLSLNGVVEQSVFLGNLYRHSVRCRDRVLLADSSQCWPVQSSVRLHVPAAALHIFPSSQAN
ncbi:Trehalose import ATP-binding protein SugC [Klebsiella electrica]|nr:Trehalose import ATP-binding protein SugC [Klebsiella electrica]